MKKNQRLISFILLLLIISFFVIFTVAFMRVSDETEATGEIQSDEYYSPAGLFTQLSIVLNGEDGKVWVTVKNEFTLFPSTVMVYVDLYSSSEFCESYEGMNLVAQNYISDLNIGESITAEASTGGAAMYWQGKMRYKIDSGNLEERSTAIVKFDAEGGIWE